MANRRLPLGPRRVKVASFTNPREGNPPVIYYAILLQGNCVFISRLRPELPSHKDSPFISIRACLLPFPTRVLLAKPLAQFQKFSTTIFRQIESSLRDLQARHCNVIVGKADASVLSRGRNGRKKNRNPSRGTSFFMFQRLRRTSLASFINPKSSPVSPEKLSPAWSSTVGRNRGKERKKQSGEESHSKIPRACGA